MATDELLYTCKIQMLIHLVWVRLPLLGERFHGRHDVRMVRMLIVLLLQPLSEHLLLDSAHFKPVLVAGDDVGVLILLKELVGAPVDLRLERPLPVILHLFILLLQLELLHALALFLVVSVKFLPSGAHLTLLDLPGNAILAHSRLVDFSLV